jgi:hypothetical protein
MRAMVEDWLLAPDGDGTILSITIGVDPARPLRALPGLARTLVGRSTQGAAGLAKVFE